MSERIRVMVVDDHDVVRRGLSVFVRSFKDITLVGEATDGEEAVKVASQILPDVILMDMLMPVMNGVEATRLIHAAHPGIRIIALTSLKSDDMIDAALAAGAVGYLAKDSSIVELSTGIRNAFKTGTVKP